MLIRRQVPHSHGESIIYALSDPFFVFPKLFNANVERWENKYKVEIPLRGLFYLPFNLVVYVASVIRSLDSVRYVINVADFAEHRWGVITFNTTRDLVNLEIDISVPLNFVTSRILRKRVDGFAESLDEAVRLYRIEKKV